LHAQLIECAPGCLAQLRVGAAAPRLSYRQRLTERFRRAEHVAEDFSATLGAL